MPIIQSAPLELFSQNIFERIGVSAADASWIAHLLVRANLRGHDSHGVIRIPQYIAVWRKGDIDANAEPVTVQEGPATALLDGKRAFGQIAARRGMQIAIDKAAAIGISAVGVFNAYHMGRLADYAELAVSRRMLALLTVNTRGGGQRMAPWGGCAPRLGTSPLAFACPTITGVPISFDTCMTVVPEGKVRIKRNRGERLPIGWALDATGSPTTDPDAIYAKPPGTLLPIGGHKGYCLGLMVEILSGIVARGGYSVPQPTHAGNAAFIVVVDISRFVPSDQFCAEVDELVGYLKSCPTIPGLDQVMIPGEPGMKVESERRKSGIYIEDQTWNDIKEVADVLKVSMPAA